MQRFVRPQWNLALRDMANPGHANRHALAGQPDRPGVAPMGAESGGPAFDGEGLVWGMQTATNHLDLNFDVDMDVLRDGRKRRVKDSAFLHVGHCVHVNILKQFMRDNGVGFQESA